MLPREIVSRMNSALELGSGLRIRIVVREWDPQFATTIIKEAGASPLYQCQRCLWRGKMDRCSGTADLKLVRCGRSQACRRSLDGGEALV